VRTMSAHKQRRNYIFSCLRLAEGLPCQSSPALHHLRTYTACHLPVLKVWGQSISLFIVGKQETRKCKAYLQATNTSSSPCPCPKLARCDLGASEALTVPETPIPHRSRPTGSRRATAGSLPDLLTHRASSEQARRKLRSLQTCPKGLAQHRKVGMAKR